MQILLKSLFDYAILSTNSFILKETSLLQDKFNTYTYKILKNVYKIKENVIKNRPNNETDKDIHNNYIQLTEQIREGLIFTTELNFRFDLNLLSEILEMFYETNESYEVFISTILENKMLIEFIQFYQNYAKLSEYTHKKNDNSKNSEIFNIIYSDSFKEMDELTLYFKKQFLNYKNKNSGKKDKILINFYYVMRNILRSNNFHVHRNYSGQN